MTCFRDDGLLTSFFDFFICLYAFESNLSLVRTVGRSLSSWSKPLDEVTTPGKGALVILLAGGTPFSPRMA